MACEWIELQVADGTKMRAYVARPESGPHAGLIVFQEAFGVNRHIRDVTERFSKQGFCAIAPELYHRTAPGQEFPYDNFQAAMPHLRAVTPDAALPDSRAAFDWLKAQNCATVSSVGFCMGGRVSFIANSGLPLTRAVSFYGGGIAPALLDRVSKLNAPMLFFWGGRDKHILADQRASLASALREHDKKYVNVEISFADHGFFCDQRPSYDAEASRYAWGLTLDFLKS
jgi:Dienelactone hydrolase and related enzymes